MSRKGACSYLVGLFVVLALAGCGGGWFMQQREPWRHEAEVACLKSGQVRITPAVTQMPAISGPGICGADFPLKVAALGESAAIGFADELRPPAPIGPFNQSTARPVAGAARYDAPSQPSYQDRYSQPSYPSPQAKYPQTNYPQGNSSQGSYPAAPAPLSLKPPGSEPEEDEAEFIESPSAPTSNNRGAITRAPLAPPSPHPYSTREGPYDPPRSQPPEPYITPPPRNHEAPGRYGAPPQTEALPPLGPPTAMPAGGSASITPAATLACPMVSALDQWVAGSVQPAAVRWFGQPVVEIKQISAYSCRGMNGNPRAHISEHAFGNALDVAAFTLADGRKVTVRDGWRGLPEERGFLRDVHAAACQQFTTVLGPGSNVYHYDHLHVDLMRRSSGGSICNPAAIPGDAVAGRRGEPVVTASVRNRARALSYADDDQSRGRSLPRAVAGED